MERVPDEFAVRVLGRPMYLPPEIGERKSMAHLVDVFLESVLVCSRSPLDLHDTSGGTERESVQRAEH